MKAFRIESQVGNQIQKAREGSPKGSQAGARSAGAWNLAWSSAWGAMGDVVTHEGSAGRWPCCSDMMSDSFEHLILHFHVKCLLIK